MDVCRVDIHDRDVVNRANQRVISRQPGRGAAQAATDVHVQRGCCAGDGYVTVDDVVDVCTVHGHQPDARFPSLYGTFIYFNIYFANKQTHTSEMSK